ncbi:PTS glucitol/sorbitol transporter subunit IIA [Aerococcus urinae]
MTIYQTEVKNIGADAELFKSENMIILFGEDAPADLADYCYNIDVNPIQGTIEAGQTISFDDQDYKITAVGSVVEKNLTDLGHISVRFDNSTEADLAGTIYVEQKELPEITIGTKASILPAFFKMLGLVVTPSTGK